MGSCVLKSLNVAYLNGCLLISSSFAFAAKSWLLFPAILVVMVCGGLYSGEIRPAAKAR